MYFIPVGAVEAAGIMAALLGSAWDGSLHFGESVLVAKREERAWGTGARKWDNHSAK